jgi:hypothetical protein
MRMALIFVEFNNRSAIEVLQNYIKRMINQIGVVYKSKLI